MHDQEVKPLVVTPRPMNGESLMGFILRTSEMNGYETPSKILQYAGMDDNEMRSVRPPLEKLAKLYAREVNDFSGISYGTSKKNKYNKKWNIQKIEIPSLYLNIKSAKICPECISENGMIESYWDLKHAFACPVHKRIAITFCPTCKKELSYFRKGLLTCRCGQDLTKLRGNLVEDLSILALLELVRSKFQCIKLNTEMLLQSGYSIEELEPLSLPTLLGIINRFEQGRKRKTTFNVPDGVSKSVHAVKITAGIFERWPQGFYDYLEGLYVDSNTTGQSTLRGKFHKFCCSFFKNGLPENEIAFLKKAFVGFGNDHKKLIGYVDTRFTNRLNIKTNIVGIKGLAEALGIMTPTAMQYVKNGLIKGDVIDAGNGKRTIFDLSKIPFKRSEGKHHRLREAAKFLGLAAGLLVFLKQEKIYTLKRLGYGLDGFSELDLVDFKESLTSQASTYIDFKTSHHITMKKVLFMKTIGVEVKGNFIKSIINNNLLPIGNIGSALGDIVFDKNQALGFLKRYN